MRTHRGAFSIDFSYKYTWILLKTYMDFEVFFDGPQNQRYVCSEEPPKSKIYMDFEMIIPRFCKVHGATPKRLGISALGRRGA